MIFFILFLFDLQASADLVKYEFDISTKTVNFTGKKAQALAIGGQIPAPTIEAKVGDTLQVTFHNKLNQETSVHWHGVLLPNDQDGVPYLTTPPIQPKTSFTYQFQITHPGTYWYHSHSGLQEQRGIYGALVFHPKYRERIPSDQDHVVVFSDWTNEKPKQVLANLKKDGDWYALKKNAVPSWDQTLRHGWKAILFRIKNSWNRMGPMDISDVGYDAFLTNGAKIKTLNAKPGSRIRLRMINAAASSYFNIEFAGGPLTLISADGMDIKPVKVKRLKIAIAETYDAILSIPESKSYELRATSEDGTGFSSLFIGQGEKVYAPHIPRPNLFLPHQSHSGHSSSHSKSHHHTNHAHQHTDHAHQHTKENQPSKHQSSIKNTPHLSGRAVHNSKHQSSIKPSSHPFKHTDDIIPYMTDYNHIEAIQNTSLPKTAKTRHITLNLTGSMSRYIWSFDNKPLRKSDRILIQKGENVMFHLVNKTMMHHPIHLHGHFFRVLNGKGERSPLKHTVNVPAMSTVLIEFAANASKDWFFHCHNLYHMKTGMSRVVSYKNSSTATKKTLRKLNKDTIYLHKKLSLMLYLIEAELKLKTSNSKNILKLKMEQDFKPKGSYDYELDIKYTRYLNKYFKIYLKGELEKEHGLRKNKTLVGIRYTLPLLIDMNVQIESTKKIVIELESDLQLTKRLKLDWKIATDKDYELELTYEFNKNFLAITKLSSDFGWNTGLQFQF